MLIMFLVSIWKVTPQVGIIMGSDSDLPVMKEAAKILKMFDVPHEVSFPNFYFSCAKSSRVITDLRVSNSYLSIHVT